VQSKGSSLLDSLIEETLTESKKYDTLASNFLCYLKGKQDSPVTHTRTPDSNIPQTHADSPPSLDTQLHGFQTNNRSNLQEPGPELDRTSIELLLTASTLYRYKSAHSGLTTLAEEPPLKRPRVGNSAQIANSEGGLTWVLENRQQPVENPASFHGHIPNRIAYAPAPNHQVIEFDSVPAATHENVGKQPSAYVTQDHSNSDPNQLVDRAGGNVTEAVCTDS
jgi:hypothetical protein